MSFQWTQNRPRRIGHRKVRAHDYRNTPTTNMAVISSEHSISVLHLPLRDLHIRVAGNTQLLAVHNVIPRGRNYEVACRFRFTWLIPTDKPTEYETRRYMVVADSTRFDISIYCQYITSIASLSDPTTEFLHIFEDVSEHVIRRSGGN